MSVDKNTFPALDPWSREAEMARMLDLCEAQMDAAMRDSDQAVDDLAKAFTSLVVASRGLGELTKEISSSGKQQALAKDLDQRCEAISKQIGEAIVAFQFYDKLTQRVGHVRYSLSALALFVCDTSHSNQPQHWHKLMNTLRRLYRTEEERLVFDSVIEGKPIETSPLAPQGSVQPEAVTGHIELF